MTIKYKKNQNTYEVSINFEIPKEALEYQSRLVREALDNLIKDRAKMELYTKTMLDLMDKMEVDAVDFANLLMMYVADLMQVCVKVVCEQTDLFNVLLEKDKEESIDEITIASLVISLIETLKNKGYEVKVDGNQNVEGKYEA